MTDYFREARYLLDSVQFDYLRGRYRGRGTLTWNPDQGCHIEAFVERHGRPLPQQIELGKTRILKPSDFRTFRMTSWQFGKAIALNVPLEDRLDLLHNHLSINVSSVVFSAPFSRSIKLSKWSGSALFEIKESVVFPDSVERETRINGHHLEQGKARAGLLWEDDQGQRIVGRMVDKTHLELHWNLSPELWSRIQSWRWPKAAGDALSILLGQTVRLLQREAFFGNHRRCEMNMRLRCESLGVLSPFYGSNERLDKETFIKLTEFFLSNDQHAHVCRNIFAQLSEASRQKTRQATELLLSTTLEAALRTINQHAFKEHDKSWKIYAGMEQFRKRFLSDSWKQSCDKALQAYRRLRHRNAHPDWLFSQGGSLSSEEMEKSLDDMIFLSRFYGYMILTLAGFKDIEPKFPIPHKEWKPLMTVTFGA